MRRIVRMVAVTAALGLVAPAWAQGDAKDTATEKKAEAKKSLRHHKPGGESAKDKREDVKDTAKSTSAKSKKKARAAGRSVNKSTRRAQERMEQK